MISTLQKRIVFCGNWTYWTPQWNSLDDDNGDMSYEEFIGKNYIKDNIADVYSKTSNKNGLERIAKNRNKLNRVIDSSEYVVRCSFGKTSNPTSNFTFNGSPSPSYGSKTDVVGETIGFSERKKHLLIKNHFNDLQIRFGVPLEGVRHQDDRRVLKSYGSRMVASKMDAFTRKESWVPMCNLYKRILDGRFTGDGLRKQLERSSKSIADAECILKQGLKGLSIENYIELCKEIQLLSVSYTELKSIIGHKRWSSPFFAFHNGSDRWMKTEEERHQWMRIVRYNWHVNRGLELIWMMMKDERFKDYDKYIIGVMGINECFKIGLDCRINQWGEYIWMSEKIKNGELFFLPEHVDKLYEELDGCIKKEKLNIYVS